MTYDEKLEIAKKLNIALREWHLNKERYDLIKKIYFAFVFTKETTPFEKR